MGLEKSHTAASFDRRAIPAGVTEGHWQAPDGLPIRRADWPVPEGPGRGSLLFMPGRADFYEKYLETLDAWQRQGWQVTAMDWRGQGMSGRFGPDGGTGHIGDFADWVDDLAAFWAQWAPSTPGPHVIVGHSMGGHLVLRALGERRIDPAAAVLVAPMLGFPPSWLPSRMMHGLARVMAGLKQARAAWRGVERPAMLLGDRSKLLTHDEARYADETWWRESRPDLAMAAPSWRWIERSLASMQLLDRRGVLEAVDTPVLLLATRCDRLVTFAPIARAARRLPRAELVAYGAEARHEILREADPVRDKALAAIRKFLDRTAPAAEGPA